MKKYISYFLCLTILIVSSSFNTVAVEDSADPVVLSFNISTTSKEHITDENVDTRATGLINSYGLTLSKSGTTLTLSGRTYASTEVVKCGFKNLMVERRKTSSDSWKEYYEYGDVYIDGIFATLNTTLSVASGYQYRISCKHYAKKSLLVTQTISNTSNIVTVS